MGSSAAAGYRPRLCKWLIVRSSKPSAQKHSSNAGSARPMVSSETCAEITSKRAPPSITAMRSALLSLLTAAGLAGCDRADTADYRVFVEEDRLLVCSVEALMAVPAVPRKQKA